MSMLRCASITILMIVLSGCVMRQQKIESEDQKAADAAAAAADAAAEILAEKAMPRIAAEQKRKEEECAANSMPVRGRMLSALVVKSASLYREASSQSKAIASLTLGEQIKVEESSAETLGADGRRWAHVEASHLVDCSPHGNVTGWLDMAAIAEEKEFKSVGRWDGPTRLDVEFGDWVGTYYFAVDGTYRSDEYRGNLYEYGDVVMGRAELNGQKVIDVFIRVENKGICWELDQSYCQK